MVNYFDSTLERALRFYDSTGINLVLKSNSPTQKLYLNIAKAYIIDLLIRGWKEWIKIYAYGPTLK